VDGDGGGGGNKDNSSNNGNRVYIGVGMGAVFLILIFSILFIFLAKKKRICCWRLKDKRNRKNIESKSNNIISNQPSIMIQNIYAELDNSVNIECQYQALQSNRDKADIQRYEVMPSPVTRQKVRRPCVYEVTNDSFRVSNQSNGPIPIYIRPYIICDRKQETEDHEYIDLSYYQR